MSARRYLSVAEVAAELGVDSSALARWARQHGDTPAPQAVIRGRAGQESGAWGADIPGWRPAALAEWRAWLGKHRGLGARRPRTNKEPSQ